MSIDLVSTSELSRGVSCSSVLIHMVTADEQPSDDLPPSSLKVAVAVHENELSDSISAVASTKESGASLGRPTFHEAVTHPVPLPSDELKGAESASNESSTAEQHGSRWRRYLRRFNVFAGAVCSQIVLCYIRSHLML